MWHALNQYSIRLIVPGNTPIGKPTALERCIAEVTSITENTTTALSKFDETKNSTHLG